MQRRRYALLLSTALGATSGCLSRNDDGSDRQTEGTPNCETLSRDVTIDELTGGDEDDQFALAGTVQETNADGRWVLVYDGTGVAKVTAESSPAGDALVDHPESGCIEFEGRVGNVPDRDDDDGRPLRISMYLGSLVSSEHAPTSTGTDA